jgi:hypothetical protein
MMLLWQQEIGMRIIKLSPDDIDFPDRASVDVYFEMTLARRDPVGQFLLTRGRIADRGIEPGEPIIFSYKTEITHTARAASGRLRSNQADSQMYPFFFLVDMGTVSKAHGNLSDVETRLAAAGCQKNIIRTQGWPIISDKHIVDSIWNDLRK